jgi:hypothetical protein
MPKKVATFQAQMVLIVVWIFSDFWTGALEELSLFIRAPVAGVAAEAQIFEDFGVEDR